MSLAFEVCGTAAMSALGGFAQPLANNGGGLVGIAFCQFADPVHGLRVDLALDLGDVDQLGGAAGAGRGGMGGAQVLRLSEEEMAAVDRLTEMGFDRTEAAQAYLACDKNEALAANLLMDGGFGGFGNNCGFLLTSFSIESTTHSIE